MHHHQPNVQRFTARRVIKLGLFTVILVVCFHHIARTDNIEISSINTNEEDVKFGRKGKVGSENVVFIDNAQKMYNEEFESIAKENLYVEQVKNEKPVLRLPSEEEREIDERNDSEEAAHSEHEIDESGNIVVFHTDNVESENTVDSQNDVETATANGNEVVPNKGQDEENEGYEKIDEDQIIVERSNSNENGEVTNEETQDITLDREEVPKRKIVELQNDNGLSYLKLKGINEPSPDKAKADSAQKENNETSSTNDESEHSVPTQSQHTESNNYKSVIENLLGFESYHSKVAESNNDEHDSTTKDSLNSEAGSVSTSEGTPNSNDDTMAVETNNAGGHANSADDDIKNKDTGIDGTSVVIVFSDQSTTYAESSIDEVVMGNKEEF